MLKGVFFKINSLSILLYEGDEYLYQIGNDDIFL